MEPIRKATTNDLPGLFELWYDRMALLAQTNPTLRLAPNHPQAWRQAAETWITNAETEFLVWQREQSYVGYIVGEIQANAPGLLPERIGVIPALVIDLHTPPLPGGTGRVLLDALLDWFKDHHICTITAHAPLLSPVEQAFWRGVGAVAKSHRFEMRL